MNIIEKCFGKPRVLLPVIHAQAGEQVQTATAVAMDNGADGVWIISHGSMPWPRVVELAEGAVRCGLPFVGVNLLGMEAHRGMAVVASAGRKAVHGLWSDDAGVDVDHQGQTDIADGKLAAERDRFAATGHRGWPGLYFGGVAFKYQAAVPTNKLSALGFAAARTGIDVVTTSGPRTGMAPSVEKVRLIRAGMDMASGGPINGRDKGLALASGVDLSNVELFLPTVDAFLVGSYLETEPMSGVLVGERVRALADKIHAYQVGAA